jgi:electron transport complex protein RnfA
MLLATLVTYLIYKYLLMPFNLVYLQTIAYILVIAGLVQMVEIVLKKIAPALYQTLGVFLPLITTNCAVLGVALNNVTDGYNFIESVINGFGTAVGYTIAIVLLAGIRSRINEEDLPKPLRGAPVVLIAAALMSIAFMGFSDLAF